MLVVRSLIVSPDVKDDLPASVFLVHLRTESLQAITQGHRGPLCHPGQGLLGPEVLLAEGRVAGQDTDDLPVLFLPFETVQDRLDPHCLLDEAEEPAAGNRLGGAVHHRQADAIDPVIQDMVLHRLLVMDVELLFAVGHLEQGRLGDVEVAPLDQLLHLPEEEGQQKRPDVEAVHVGVGHDDHLVVPQLADVLIAFPCRSPRRGR